MTTLASARRLRCRAGARRVRPAARVQPCRDSRRPPTSTSPFGWPAWATPPTTRSASVPPLPPERRGLGHVCVDLATIRQTASSDVDTPADLTVLPWPDPATVGRTPGRERTGRRRTARCTWRTRPSTSTGSGGTSGRWRATSRPGHRRRSTSPEPLWLPPWRASSSDSDDDPDLQRLAAAAALVRRVSVRGRGPGHRQDAHGGAGPRAARRVGPGGRRSPATHRLGGTDRQGGGASGGGVYAPVRTTMPVDDAVRGASARAAGEHDPPAARVQPREPQPLPPQPRQPAPLRRGRGRRDLHGLALAHGPSGRGGAARGSPDPRGRPRTAGVGGSRRRSRRHRRTGVTRHLHGPRRPDPARRADRAGRASGSRTARARSATGSSSSRRCTATGAPSRSWRTPSTRATRTRAVAVLERDGTNVEWIASDVAGAVGAHADGRARRGARRRGRERPRA